MEVRQIRTEGLGDSTYILAHDGLGLIVDPQRDIDRFVSVVDELDVEIRWVFETHLHNDYVSGGLDAAKALGADLILPAGAAPAFRHTPAFHNEEMTHGDVTVRPLHTPGHTPEHTSFLITIAGDEAAVFSGGSLLVASAGRSDLLGAERSDTLARLQYQSINRLARLEDDTLLYPTHGAGSFCSASASSGHSSTIGTERKSNPALQPQSEEEFVQSHLSGLAAYPDYYRYMAPINLAGPEPLVLDPPPTLDENSYDRVSSSAITIDARSKKAFAAGHLSGSIGIELRNDFGVWVGWVTEHNAQLILVMEDGQSLDEAQRQLSRIGYDRVVGVVRDLHEWDRDLESFPTHDVDAFIGRMTEGQVLDVRAPDEWSDGVLDGSFMRYVPDIYESLPDLDRDQPVLVACGTGYRASIAASELERQGFRTEVLIDAGVPEVLESLKRSTS